MPIKLPKGFPRRKASGNALEEVQNPPEPSFKVFERPGGLCKSFDGGHNLKRPVVIVREQARPPPGLPDKDDYNEELFPVYQSDPIHRGSRGTENSTTSGHDDGTPSDRLSSSSTDRSSLDTPSDPTPQASKQPRFFNIPLPAAPPRLELTNRNAGRTPPPGVLPMRPVSKDLPAKPPTAPLKDKVETFPKKERAMTTSTSTTHKLLDADLQFEDIDGFGNLFDNIGKRTSRSMSSSYASKGNKEPLSPQFPVVKGINDSYSHISPPPASRSNEIVSSPYSWSTQESGDRLMRSPSPLAHTARNSTSLIIPRKSLPTSNSVPQSSSNQSFQSQGFEDEPLFGVQHEQSSQNSPTATGDENSSPQSVSIQKAQTGFHSNREKFEKTASASNAQESSVRPASSRGKQAAEPEPSLAASMRVAHKWEKQQPKNKVMTPAQFELYKREQEQEQLKENGSKGDVSDEEFDDDEDDDEAERNRQAAKQRRKQEAHLAVYRQTMMKVTGQQPTRGASTSPNSAALRVGGSGASKSPSRLSPLHGDSKNSVPSRKGSHDDDEEDEDIPLGILVAHGFPNKNKPPTRPSSSLSDSNLLRASTSSETNLPGGLPVGEPSSRPASISGEPRQNSSGNLPVFARHLPPDPYFGAGLVNPSNRESFALGGGSPGQAAASESPAAVHPAGLVGVIAGEERARAIRRGSPRAGSGFDIPGTTAGVMRSQTMGNLAHPGMMPGPPVMPTGVPIPMNSADQAQLQMSQQMAQMMQMQMLWMQQMMQMQGAPPGQMPPGFPQQIPPGFASQMPPMGQPFGISPGFMAPPSTSQFRPVSLQGPASARRDQRTMSTLSPNMAPWNNPPPSMAPHIHFGAPQPGYTPSIAPSERSNVGMASRYRPVSIAPDSAVNTSKRTSTFMSGMVPPWSNSDLGQPVPSPGQLAPTSARTPSPGNVSLMARTPSPLAEQRANTAPSAQTLPNIADEDDDEQGWAEMAKKREKKKSSWRMKKGSQTGLKDLFHTVT